MRLTVNSSFLGDAVLTQKGDKLYYCAAFENGYDLWEHNFKENTTKLLIKGVGGGTMFPDKKGENIFLVSGGQLKKIEIKDSKTKPIAFKAEFSYRERTRIYIPSHLAPSIRQVLRSQNTWYQLGRIWKGIRKISSAYQQ